MALPQLRPHIPDEPYLGSDSVYFKFLGDVRNLFLGPRMLVLQTAHPQVGAAVKQYSAYRSDPWTRLYHTVFSLFTYTYGTQEQAAKEKSRLDALHRPLVGQDEKGRRFSGMNPDARLWVHATFFEVTRVLGATSGKLTDVEQHRVYDEWKQIGRMLGIPDRDLPNTIEDFDAYRQHMIDDVLEDGSAVQDVIDVVRHLPPPTWLPLPRVLWDLAMRLPVQVVWLYTVGTLPPELRERFHVRWTPEAERDLNRSIALVRTLGDRLPARLKYLPVANKAQRQARRGRTLSRVRSVIPGVG